MIANMYHTIWIDAVCACGLIIAQKKYSPFGGVFGYS